MLLQFTVNREIFAIREWTTNTPILRMQCFIKIQEVSSHVVCNVLMMYVVFGLFTMKQVSNALEYIIWIMEFKLLRRVPRYRTQHIIGKVREPFEGTTSF